RRTTPRQVVCSSEHVLFGWAHQLERTIVGTAPCQTTHDHDRLALGALPHHERRSGSDLVRMPGDADLKLAAEQIGRATQVHQRREASGANRDAAGPAPPGAAEAV